MALNTLNLMPSGSIKTNIQRMLQLQNDQSCCFDAAIWAHVGILPKSLESDEDFVEALGQHGFKQIKERQPSLGDIVCLTYWSSVKNPSVFGDRLLPIVRYQHAFVVLDDVTVFQKNGGGRHCRFEITTLSEVLMAYNPKLYTILQLGGTVAVSSMLAFNPDTILCYRHTKSECNVM